MKIRRIRIAAIELKKLSKAERNYFFLAGHMLNELNSLHKVFAWSRHKSQTASLVGTVETAQALIYARLLAGKLLEAWEELRSCWFSVPELSRDLGATLHPVAQDGLAKLKAYFSATNLIFSVRNSFAFHYSAEEVGAHWEQACGEPNFEIVLGGSIGNNCNLMSEIAVNVALFRRINPDAQVGMNEFINDVQVQTGNFTAFLEGSSRAVVEKMAGVNMDLLGSVDHIEPGLEFDEIRVPYFYDYDGPEA